MLRLFIKEETLMANKQVKICSTSHITREIQVETEIASFTSVRLVEIFKVWHPKYRQRQKAPGTFIRCWRKHKLVQFWRAVFGSS